MYINFETTSVQEGVDYALTTYKTLSQAFSVVTDMREFAGMRLPNSREINPAWDYWNNVKNILKSKMELVEEVANKVNALKEKRQQENKEGKNLHTTYPIFTVYDRGCIYHEATSDYAGSVSVAYEFQQSRDCVISSENREYVIYLDSEKDMANVIRQGDAYYDEENEILYDEHMIESYYDRFCTVCFTLEAAELYKKTEGHNLNEPFIYVNAIPRRNQEMQAVLELLGDKW